MSPVRPLHNFSAGPAILPAPVLERASAAVHELKSKGHSDGASGAGLSILEISHRGRDYTEINEQAIDLCHEVLGIPRTHQVMFLQGGASLQFAMVPMNLNRPNRVSCYVDTGVWAGKAIKESRVLGETRVLASAQETGFDHIPEIGEIPSDASYLHLTTNNTIYGTEYPEIPRVRDDIPLVVDASSHIGSRPLDFSRVALGYAGAQKNLGPSGVTLVFADKDLLKDTAATVSSVPHYLRYTTHAKTPGVYNTPNTFGVLVLKLVLEWLRDEGGIEAAATRNAEKSSKLYTLLDSSSLFDAHALPGHRSHMNIPWTLRAPTDAKPDAKPDALTVRFLSEAQAAGFSGLKGHRSVGGCRASIYNALPIASVNALVEFMREFERKA